MTEEQRLRRKCNQYAKRLVLLGEDDVVWEAEPTLQNKPSNSDYTRCPECVEEAEYDELNGEFHFDIVIL